MYNSAYRIPAALIEIYESSNIKREESVCVSGRANDMVRYHQAEQIIKLTPIPTEKILWYNLM